MKPSSVALALPIVLLSFSVLAQPPTLKPQTQGEVSFISGGVGADEQAAMQNVRGDYNLSLLFSVPSGAFLSDVGVRIADSRGKVCLETRSDGPKLFAKLKPGRYVINVERDGQALHKSVTVGGGQATPVSFVLPQQKGD